MSILDFMKNKTAAPSPIDYAMGMDTEAQLRSQLDPKNMSMGQKLSLMGQAMHAAGSGQSGAEAFRKLGTAERERKDGIRQRFQQLQESKRQKARDERGDFVSDRGYGLNVAKADQSQANSDRTFDYNAGQDTFTNNMTTQKYLDGVGQTQYDRGRDTILDGRYADQTTYNRGQDTFGNNMTTQNYLDGVDQTNYDRNRDTLLDTRALDETNYNRNQDILAGNRTTQTYLDKRNDADRDAALLGENFYFDKTQPKNGQAGLGRDIVAMDQRGNPQTIKPGDPTYKYYASALQRKEEVATAKLNKSKKMGPFGEISKFDAKRDEKFATELENTDFTKIAANSAVLTQIADGLANGTTDPNNQNILGGEVDRFLSFIDKDGNLPFRALLTEGSLDTQQKVARVVQESLKATLGAQFTQLEGKMLIERSYNPGLSPEANAQRLRLIAQIAQAGMEEKQAKRDYVQGNLEQYGYSTLQGYEDKMSGKTAQLIAQFDALAAEQEKAQKTRSSNSTSGTTSTGPSWSISN